MRRLLTGALVAFAACGPAELEIETDVYGDDAAVDTGELTTTKRQLQYIVTAHPDDEIAGWSLIERSTHNYPVFIVLTQGEETSYCTPAAKPFLQDNLGERAPHGNPYEGKHTSACRAARITSWHRFLDGMANADPTLPKVPGFRGLFTGTGNAKDSVPGYKQGSSFVADRSFRVYANEKGARVVFNLGDGDLTPGEVTWAVQQVRSRRAELFPRIPEYAVIGASYRNGVKTLGCDVYDHHDHRNVHVALWNDDQGVPGPQYARTCINDSDVDRVNDVSADMYEYAMGVNAPTMDPARYPNAFRTGVFQVNYGWLEKDFWRGQHTLEGTAHMGRRQAFWRRH